MSSPTEVCRLCGKDFSVDPDQVKDVKGQSYHRSCYVAHCRRLKSRKSAAAATPESKPPADVLPPADALPTDDFWDELSDPSSEEPAGLLAGGVLLGRPVAQERPAWLYPMIGIGIAVPVLLLLFIVIQLILGGSEPKAAASKTPVEKTAKTEPKTPPPRVASLPPPSPRPEILEKTPPPPPPPPPPQPEPPSDQPLTLEQAVAAIEALGGRVSRDDSGRVVKVFLNRTQIQDDQMKLLEVLPDVEVLNLTGTPVTDVGLDCVGALKKLRHLYPAKTPITDDALDELTQALPECKVYR